MHIVTLERHEFIQGARLSNERTIKAICDGRKLQKERTDLGFDSDVRGLLAEQVVAKYEGRYWSPMIGGLDRNQGDGGGLQIKSIEVEWHSLVIQPEDPPGFPYVLVYLPRRAQWQRGAIRAGVCGWTWGYYGKVDRFWREASSTIRTPAFFVPQDELFPMEILREEMEARNECPF